MDNKKLIIIIALVAVIAILCFSIYMSLNSSSNVEYQTIKISNASTIQVPISNEAKSNVDNLGILYYEDPKHDLQVIAFNSETGSTLSGAVQMASLRDNLFSKGTPSVEDNVTVYFIKDTNEYVIFTGNDTTHDNVLIVCKDKDMALTVYKSIKFVATANATLEEEPEVETPQAPANNTTDSHTNQNSINNQRQLDKAYYQGYSNGYDNAVDDMNYYNDYYGGVEPATDSSDSSSSSASSYESVMI